MTDEREIGSGPHPPAVRTLVICPTICPGGGPPGYTYNLRAGLAELVDDPELGATAGGVRFLGIELGTRNRATGAAPADLREAPNRPASARLAAGTRAAARRLSPRAAWRRARKTLKRWRTIAGADIVVFQGYQPAAEARWARRAGKTVIYMPHSPSIFADEVRMMRALTGSDQPVGDSEHRALQNKERALFAAADVVVFPTAHAVEPYKDAFGEVLASRRVAYVLSGVEPPAIADTTGAGPDALFSEATTNVLFVGRYVPHKGYDLFLDAAERLTGEGVDAAFWTLGDGPLKRPSRSVTDLGWRDAPHAVIAQADIIVVANRTAYFDLLPLEAAALGRGLVLTRVGGNIDQLELLPDSVGSEPDALAEAVRAAIALRRASAAWGQQNAEAFHREFTHVHMARRWASLIADVASSRRDRRSRRR
ncbi:glycosyltransferase family 4 protein [Cryobacterium sp. 1639]|uniref:glycosyltransferase family 4 protein n=1 Tax=Cryobacterium inferilacus TaxID=2866629 RepID=UPI001C73DC17|nr:glycosyltransferase family 4 protein [Cryobacterium sp. 1639]MBX0301330.1 glycosyltransferase family 4 protein [Cryobacterium sp. 1639]